MVGNLTSVTDPGNFATTYEYDSFGRLTRAIDANQHPTVFSDYHETGFPQLITDALGGTVETAYDPRGNVLQVIDEVDAITTVDYDVFSPPSQAPADPLVLRRGRDRPCPAAAGGAVAHADEASAA